MAVLELGSGFVISQNASTGRVTISVPAAQAPAPVGIWGVPAILSNGIWSAPRPVSLGTAPPAFPNSCAPRVFRNVVLQRAGGDYSLTVQPSATLITPIPASPGWSETGGLVTIDYPCGS